MLCFQLVLRRENEFRKKKSTQQVSQPVRGRTAVVISISGLSSTLAAGRELGSQQWNFRLTAAACTTGGKREYGRTKFNFIVVKSIHGIVQHLSFLGRLLWFSKLKQASGFFFSCCVAPADTSNGVRRPKTQHEPPGRHIAR